MTTADELSINNLIGNVRNAKKAVDDSKRKCEEIRQYCIDAVRDNEDTTKKLIEIINNNKDLWKNPRLNAVSDKSVSCMEGTVHTTKGRFQEGSIIIFVDNVSVYFKNDNICSQCYSTIQSEAKNWNCTGINRIISYREDLETRNHPLAYHGWNEEKLVKADFEARKWLILKECADATRVNTERLVKAFKEMLSNRIKGNEELLNRVDDASSQTYRKVGL